VGQELGGFDSPDRVLHDLDEFASSFVRDGGLKKLNLGQSLADEHYLCDLSNACHPRITNQLRIESQQSDRLLRIAAGSGFPLQQAAGPV
jgi:hypothetical protein